MSLHITPSGAAAEPTASIWTSARSTDRWILCACFVAFFFPTLRWLTVRWAEGDSYGHGFLVVPLALLFLHRAVLERRKSAASAAAYALVAVLGLAWAFAYTSKVQVVQDALLPLLLLAAFGALYGWQGVRAVALPVGLFTLSLPIWDYTVRPLQLLTANAVGAVFTAVDFPVLVEGDLVHVTRGTFEVAGGCAGIGFVLVAAILSITYGQLYLRSNRARLGLLLAGLALALVVNWIRVALVIVVGNTLGMDHPLVVDHAWMGWVLFAAAMVPLYAYARRLELRDERAVAARTDNGSSSPAHPNGSAASYANLALVVVVLGLGPAWALLAALAPEAQLAVHAPEGSSRWTGPLPNESSWRPRFIGAASEVSAAYRRDDGRSVNLYANVYTHQTQTAELVGNENSVIGDWTYVDEPSARLPDSVAAVRARSRTGPQWLVWYWYDVGGRRTSSDLVAKLYQGAMGLVGARRAGIIALATECAADCGEAATQLEAFLADVQPSLPALMVPSLVGEESK